MYQYICQIECHKACQIECQNKYQIECQKECQIECHKCFQMICLKLCQNCVSGWGSMEESIFSCKLRSDKVKINIILLFQFLGEIWWGFWMQRLDMAYSPEVMRVVQRELRRAEQKRVPELWVSGPKWTPESVINRGPNLGRTYFFCCDYGSPLILCSTNVVMEHPGFLQIDDVWWFQILSIAVWYACRMSMVNIANMSRKAVLRLKLSGGRPTDSGSLECIPFVCILQNEMQ
jgi:hypothetical protein